MKAVTCWGCSKGFSGSSRSLVWTSTSFWWPHLEAKKPPVSDLALASQCGRRLVAPCRRGWSIGRRGRSRRRWASRTRKTWSRRRLWKGVRVGGAGLGEPWQLGMDRGPGTAAWGSGSRTCMCTASHAPSSWCSCRNNTSGPCSSCHSSC